MRFPGQNRYWNTVPLGDCLENCTARAPKLHSACCDRQWCLSRQNPLCNSSLVRGIHGELQKKAVGVQSTEFSEVAVLRTSCSQKIVRRGASFPFECSTVRETATESRPQRRSATRRVYSTNTVVSSWKTGCFSWLQTVGSV